jgi:hypothetical protein
VWLAPDGSSIVDGVTVPLRGRPLHIGRGAALLARMTGATSVPIAAGWRGRRIGIDVGEPLRPRASAPDAWEREWLTSYVTTTDAWTTRTPENLPARGSLYERLLA